MDRKEFVQALCFVAYLYCSLRLHGRLNLTFEIGARTFIRRAYNNNFLPQVQWKIKKNDKLTLKIAVYEMLAVLLNL